MCACRFSFSSFFYSRECRFHSRVSLMRIVCAMLANVGHKNQNREFANCEQRATNLCTTYLGACMLSGNARVNWALVECASFPHPSIQHTSAIQLTIVDYDAVCHVCKCTAHKWWCWWPWFPPSANNVPHITKSSLSQANPEPNVRIGCSPREQLEPKLAIRRELRKHSTNIFKC